MSSAETWTVGRLLQWTTDFLKQRGAASPRLDAEVLLAKARGCQRIELYTAFNDVVTDDVRATFREFVKQRADGVPVAYLVGHKEFFSLPFVVTPDVLIPRPETESLVMAVLDLAKNLSITDRPIEVADVGTGSGAIAVAVAKRNPNVHVCAFDISPAALSVARQNVDTNGIGSQVDLIESDLFANAPPGRMYDIIASNPPYVSEEEMKSLAVDVAKHEPHLALCSGPTGTEVIARLIPQAAERLRTGGTLLIEISPMIQSQVLELFAKESRFANTEIVKDLAGQPRIAISKRTMI